MKTKQHLKDSPRGYIGCDQPAVLFGRLIHPAGEPVYRCADHTGHLDFTHRREDNAWRELVVVKDVTQMVEVSLTISFDDLLGASPDAMTVDERKSRWSEWLAIADRDAKECADAWRDVSACCEGGVCRHLDGGWCKLMELPATVNPYLSRRMGIPGMACMGAGHEVPGAQLELFDALDMGEGAA